MQAQEIVSHFVMAGLVPAIHDFLAPSHGKQAVDARNKSGHDGVLLHLPPGLVDYRDAGGFYSRVHVQNLEQRFPGLDPVPESLLPELFLGLNAAENTVDELVDMGIVDVAPAGALTLTAAGQDRNHALLARARSIEARELSDIPQSEIASCRRVLSRLVERTPSV